MAAGAMTIREDEIASSGLDKSGRCEATTRARPAVSEFPLKVEPLSMPQTMFYAPRIDGRLRIRRPFTVNVNIEHDAVTVVAQELEEFGYGPNISDALNDLDKTIVELYFALNADPETLSPHLLELRSILDTHIERIHG